MHAIRVGVTLAALAYGGCSLNFGGGSNDDDDDDVPSPDAQPPPDAPQVPSCNVTPGSGNPAASGTIRYAAQLDGQLGNTLGTDVARRMDGDYFVSGTRTGVSDSDMLIARFALDGCPRWVRSWNNPAGNDYPLGIATVADGGAFVAGAFSDHLELEALDLNGDGFEGMVFKIDGQGTPVFSSALAGPQDGERFYDVATGRDGESVVVVGTFDGAATFGAQTVTSIGDSDIIIAKLTSFGAIEWVRTFGGGRSDVPRAVTITPDGNVVVVGQTESPVINFGGEQLWAANPQRDSFIVMLGGDGSHRWSKRITGGRHDRARAVDDDASGVYVAGDWGGTVDFGLGPITSAPMSNDGYVIKYSHDGQPQWMTQIRGSSGVEIDAVVGSAPRAIIAVNALAQVTIGGQLVPGGRKVIAGLSGTTGAFAWAITGTGPNSETALAMTQQSLLATGGYVGGFTMGNVTMPTTTEAGLFTMSIAP